MKLMKTRKIDTQKSRKVVPNCSLEIKLVSEGYFTKLCFSTTRYLNQSRTIYKNVILI